MIKTLKKVGNSNAVFLDKSLMELVGLKENSALQIHVHGGSIILTPVAPYSANQNEFEACLDKVTLKRKKVLKRLAK